MKLKWHCDEPDCPAEFLRLGRQDKTMLGEIQHHLYMAHHVEVIESHRRAAAIMEK
jgi:hypothetical protein